MLKSNLYQEPSFENGWLSGYIDAKGEFKIIEETTGEINLKFEIGSEDSKIIEKIRELFKKKKENQRQEKGETIMSLTEQKDHFQLIKYLKKYPLQSHTSLIYIKWLKVQRIKEKGIEMTEKEKRKIKKMIQVIKKWREE